jgi:2-polyprenyl-3-methyl-5-hydroxy-6-metoxy-1,4-benzoquinol methylase
MSHPVSHHVLGYRVWHNYHRQKGKWGSVKGMKRVVGEMRRIIEGVPYLLKTGYMQTGERVNPDFPDANFNNHLKVYQFAAQFVPGKRVLDIGSGTGYGSEYLAAYASSVTGIDYSKTAVRFAQSRYKRPTFR